MVRHSRERALSEREFERLLQGIERIDCDWYRLQTRFVVIVAGRLGMRAGEIAHMRSEWIFGWVQLETAMKYIQSSGTNTQRALNAVHSR